MNILVLGGSQLVGPGLPDGKSYVGQMARRLQADGHRVQIDPYGPISMGEASALLSKLRLYQYDFILLQLGETELCGPLTVWQRLRLLMRGNRSAACRQLRHDLATILMMVQPYRHQTLLLTPLPQPQTTHSLLLRLGRRLFLEEANMWAVPAFDVGTLLTTDPEFFQHATSDNLSDLAHELLGSELHTQLSERAQAPPSPPRRPRPFHR